MPTSNLLRFRPVDPAPEPPTRPNMRRLMVELVADFTILAIRNPDALLKVVAYVRHHANPYRRP